MQLYNANLWNPTGNPSHSAFNTLYENFLRTSNGSGTPESFLLSRCTNLFRTYYNPEIRTRSHQSRRQILLNARQCEKPPTPQASVQFGHTLIPKPVVPRASNPSPAKSAKSKKPSNIKKNITSLKGIASHSAAASSSCVDFSISLPYSTSEAPAIETASQETVHVSSSLSCSSSQTAETIGENVQLVSFPVIPTRIPDDPAEKREYYLKIAELAKRNLELLDAQVDSKKG
jgi:hypothetical protein